MAGLPAVVFIQAVLLTRSREESGTTLPRERGHPPPGAPMASTSPAFVDPRADGILTGARSRPSVTSPQRDRPRLGTARPGLVDTVSVATVATSTNAVLHILHADVGGPGMEPFLSHARRTLGAPDAVITMATKWGVS
jgi:hypothetical protein